ncbi:hypothetical protein [Actinomadura nitritigenes]|nr:hypothetical protein [Actinomadura nitritigenes]
MDADRSLNRFPSSGQVLALDIKDLLLRNRRANVRRKGGAVDTIV